jgi:O-antigen biosynthesis protein
MRVRIVAPDSCSEPRGPVLASRALRGDSATEYYSRCRHDVLALVPPTARTILSVGCAAGATEGELVRRGVTVVGVELDPVAAAAARERGVHVIEGDAGALHPDLAQWRFDCLIYADVLEHLLDPVAVLRAHLAHLLPGGTVVISVPNFRHITVFVQLFLRGHVRYVDAGILDRTHVRLTTRRLVLQWLTECGLTILHSKYIMHRRRDRWLAASLASLADEFIASQVIVVAKKAAPAAGDRAW